MKRYHFWLVFIGLLISLPLNAQKVLTIPEVAAASGQGFQIPISMENDEEFTAIQFDLLLDDKISLDEKVTPTDRWVNHTSAIKRLDSGRYRVICYSSDNSAFRGNSGNILLLQGKAASSCAQGEEYPVSVDNLIVSRSDGSAWDCGVRNGKILITQTPDLMVKDVAFTGTTCAPEGTLECTWTVQNVGTLATESGFREQIYLTDNEGKITTLLQSSFCGSTLNINEEISRSSVVTIPAVPGLGGNCRIMVKITPYSDSGEPESMKGNDTALSEAILQVGKRLYISPVESKIEEKLNNRATYRITRSGSIAEEETFLITCDRADERISFPSEVKIPVGSSSGEFRVTVTPNEKHDPEDMVKFKVEGNEYEAVEANLKILDDTPAEMTVTLSSDEVEEGGKVDLTIDLPAPLSHDLIVYFVTDKPKRLNLPESVTIPAGETRVSVTVITIDDDEADNDVDASIKISCDNMETVEEFIFIKDDDMPELQFTLTPDAVDENAGPYAVTATITRLTNSDKRARLKIFDDSEGELVIPNRVITMERGEKSRVFSMGIRDNALVDGERTYNVGVAVYPSSCDCVADEATSAHVTRTLTVVDDDSPHLSITSRTQAFIEGSSGNILTVSRNTSPDDDLTVTISSDNDDRLEYSHTVVIPKGENSVEVKVEVPENDVTADAGIVCFKAEAEGMSAGTCWVAITDQTLPDATVSLKLLSDSPQNIFKAGEKTDLLITVSNTGNAVLPTGTPIEIYCSGIKGSTKISTETEVEKGAQIEIPVNGFTLPDKTGNVILYAQVNRNREIGELLYTNNRSQDLNLTLSPAFTAKVSVDKSDYRVNDEVVITGETDGDLGKNATVEIRLVNNGITQRLNCMSDEEGKFTCRHILLADQTGHFSVAAGYPYDLSAQPSAEFDVYGLKIDKSQATSQFKVGETTSHIFYVTNNCAVDLNDVKVAAKEESKTCKATVNAPSSIKVGQTVPVSVTLKGLKPSGGVDWESFSFTLSTKEGEDISFTTRYYIDSQKGFLETDVNNISTTMQIDTPREYPIELRNTGRGETGLVTFSLPSWITASPKQISSLASGESVNVILTFNPWEGIELNRGNKGHLGINCTKADGVRVNFDITPVSEKEGAIKVDVVDEYSFHTEEAPHVAQAYVQVLNPSTKVVVTDGYTGKDGLFNAKLKEGWYELKVEAGDHKTYNDNIIISPDIELSKEVFIPHNGVNYEWEVNETEIEDEYTVETHVKYDVRVPKPVLIIDFPSERPEVNSVIPVSVTNKGYIKAVNLAVSLRVSEGYKIEWLNSPSAAEIGAGETLTFFAKLLSDNADEPLQTRATTISDAMNCIKFIVEASGDNLCDKYKDRDTVVRMAMFGNGACVSSSDGLFGTPGGGNGGYYGGCGDFPYMPGSPTTEIAEYELPALTPPSKFCDPVAGTNDDGNDPIPLPIVPNEKYKEQNCGEKPILNIKMIPMKGPRYEYKGLTADGASQMKIILDPSASLIPNSECSTITDIQWELTKDAGKLEGSSIYQAVYTAPEDFDESLASEGNFMIETEAVLSCTIQEDSGATYTVKSNPVKILIFRPAIVFVHGLGDSETCWKSFADRLVTSEGYLDQLIYRVDYKATNTSHFAVNVSKIGEGIKRVRRQAQTQGIYVGKVDLVGHSMGGILSRLYVQNGNHDNEINRIITVNTPHSGSEIGDMVMTHPKLGDIAILLYSLTNLSPRLDLGAVEDLATGSQEIRKLNTMYRTPQIPVLAFGTETSDPVSTTTATIFNSSAQAVIGEIFKTTGSILGTVYGGKLGGILGTLLGVIVKYSTMASLSNPLHFTEDYLQCNPGDLVVSSESQRGGCSSSYLMAPAPMHVFAPKNYDVQTNLITFLKDYDKKSFSNKWFNPEKRSFKCAGRFSSEEIGMDILGVYIDAGVSAIAEKALFSVVKDKALVKLLKKEVLNKDILKDMLTSFTRSEDNSQTVDSVEYEYRLLKVEIDPTDVDRHLMSVVNIGDELYCYDGSSFECPVPNSFKGDVKVTFLSTGEDGAIYYSIKEIPFDSYNATPDHLEAEDVYMEVGENSIPMVYCHWSDGTVTRVAATDVTMDTEGIMEFSNGEIKGKKCGFTKATLFFEGLNVDVDAYVFSPASEMAEEDKSDAICSKVTLSFTQSVKMTRQAFRGILKVNNGHTTATLRNFKLNLKVTDEDGYSTSRKEFEITPEKLTGFAGNLDFESGWSLAPGTDGIAEILFIPTKNAAPTTPKMYDFGGTVSYTDPFTGLDVTRDLEAVRLTVNPSPILDLTYFMQRDVMADDPLTPDVEESSEPAEFAVVVTNKGYGDAKNLKFETRQPEIIDNEKGLAIEFEIESSQLNGAEKTLHLKNSIVNDFGTIEAQKSAYAQWWLRSSLLGHFVDYDVKVTHVTSYDNPDLSLIENASIHELIHGFTVDENAEIPVRGFLVNDIEDKENVPDMVYFSDGKESEMVATGKNAEIKADGENTYIITLPFNPSGWYYYVMKDPTAGNKVVTSVKRMSDGKELPLDNIWQTDRTLLDGKDPMYENRLHFVVNSEETGSYRVEFKDKRENTLEVSDIELLYAEPVEGLKYVDGVRIRFNNSVMDGTFTVDDIAMHRDGTLVALDEAVVTKEDANCYYMALNDIAQPDGDYTFMVIPSGILDEKGFAGGVPRTASWTSSFVAEVVEPVAGSEVRVFPIPMESEVRIECPYREEVRVGIYDSLGKMMYVNDNYISDNPIDVLGWETGVYIIRVVTPEKEHVVKAVKK